MVINSVEREVDTLNRCPHFLLDICLNKDAFTGYFRFDFFQFRICAPVESSWGDGLTVYLCIS
jgi:hypothetical protein